MNSRNDFVSGTIWLGSNADVHLLNRNVQHFSYWLQFTRTGRSCSSEAGRVKTTAKVENGILGVANSFTHPREARFLDRVQAREVVKPDTDGTILHHY